MTVLRRVVAVVLVLIGFLAGLSVYPWWAGGLGAFALLLGLVAALCALSAWLLWRME